MKCYPEIMKADKKTYPSLELVVYPATCQPSEAWVVLEAHRD